MAEEGLRLGDIEMGQDEIRTSVGWDSVRSRLWTAIGEATNTAPILTSIDGRQVVVYIGREPGPEVATYLHLVTDRAMDREIKVFRSTTWYKRRRTLKAKRLATASFTSGMVYRLWNKLDDLFAGVVDPVALERAIEERGARFSKSTSAKPRRTSTSGYWEAASQGADAAAGVSLNHGVGTAAAPLAIGGGK